jgi:hypothetical protein
MLKNLVQLHKVAVEQNGQRLSPSRSQVRGSYPSHPIPAARFAGEEALAHPLTLTLFARLIDRIGFTNGFVP